METAIYIELIKMADIKWIATSLVSLVVAVIVIATIAVPVVEDMTTSVQGGNNGTPIHRYTDYTGQEVTFTWASGVSTLGDGTVVPSTSTPVNNRTISPNFISDKVVFRGGSGGFYLYMFDINERFVTTNTTHVVVITVAANGNYTVTLDNVEKATGTLSLMLIADPSGTIGQYDEPIKAVASQPVYIGNWVSNYGPMYLETLVNGSVSATLISPSAAWTGTTITQADSITHTIVYEDADGIGEYKSIETAYGSGSTTEHYFLYAPIDYGGDEDEGTSGVNIVLLGIIPVLLFVVAVMMAVRVIRL